jgi:hypothetical protein
MDGSTKMRPFAGIAAAFVPWGWVDAGRQRSAGCLSECYADEARAFGIESAPMSSIGNP